MQFERNISIHIEKKELSYFNSVSFQLLAYKLLGCGLFHPCIFIDLFIFLLDQRQDEIFTELFPTPIYIQYTVHITNILLENEPIKSLMCGFSNVRAGTL